MGEQRPQEPKAVSPTRNELAMVLLGILRDLCRVTGLVAEFKRGDIKDLNFSFETVLISAPNLNNRTAALLGNMTNRDFMIVDQRSYIYWAGSRAIYIGEEPAIKQIQHSIQINLAPTNAEPPNPPEWLQGGLLALPQHYARRCKTRPQCAA
jgi:hypothetical protein